MMICRPQINLLGIHKVINNLGRVIIGHHLLNHYLGLRIGSFRLENLLSTNKKLQKVSQFTLWLNKSKLVH